MPYGQEIDNFAPFTGPYLKMLHIQGLIEDMKAKKEMRQWQREDRLQQIQDRQRQAAMQDLNATLLLHKIGAVPDSSGGAAFDAAMQEDLGPVEPGTYRQPISVGGKNYRLPSRRDESEMDSRENARTATLKKQAKDIEDPMVALPEGMQNELNPPSALDVAINRNRPALRVRESGLAGVLNNYQRNNRERPEPAPIVTRSTDNEGNVHTRIIPRNGGAARDDVNRGAGKSSRTINEKSGLSTRAEKALKDAQAMIDRVMVPANSDIGSSPIGRQKRAENAVKLATMAHPDELEGATDAQGYSYIKPKSSAGGKASGKGNRIQASKEPIAASALNEILTHPDVQARGIKDINALRKDLYAHGYKIDDSK